ncbi:MAG: hypothetical protein ACYCWE_16845 [Eubacteriales bacterium]
MSLNQLKKKQIAAFTVALLILFVFITSCTDNVPGVKSDITADTTEETTAEENKYEAGYLPDVQYDGYQYRIISYEEYPAHSEELNGNAINDAIYTRNALIEERYNIEFVETRFPFTNYKDVEKLMLNAGRAQSDDFDLCTLVFQDAYNGVIQGLLPTASKLPVADVSQPWYIQSTNDSMVVDGIMLFAFTAFDKNPGGACIVFNKKIMDDLNIDYPYRTVDDGTWTYEKLYKTAVEAIYDVNGDGKMTAADRFSFISEYDRMTELAYYGRGLKIVDFSQEIPVVSQDERLFEMFDMLSNYIGQKGFLLDTFAEYGTAEASRISGNTLFASGGSLFMLRGTSTLTTMGAMEDDYGIVPFPKWDAEQNDYFVPTDGGNIALPLTCSSDLERVCVIKEALAVESLNIYYPVYYESSLKNRYLRDEDSLRMLEIITNSVTWDLGSSLWWDVVRQPWLSCLQSNKKDFASAVTKNLPKGEKVIDTLMTTIAAIK